MSSIWSITVSHPCISDFGFVPCDNLYHFFTAGYVAYQQTCIIQTHLNRCIWSIDWYISFTMLWILWRKYIGKYTKYTHFISHIVESSINSHHWIIHGDVFGCPEYSHRSSVSVANIWCHCGCPWTGQGRKMGLKVCNITTTNLMSLSIKGIISIYHMKYR